jgi:hypothetical protein
VAALPGHNVQVSPVLQKHLSGVKWEKSGFEKTEEKIMRILYLFEIVSDI